MPGEQGATLFGLKVAAMPKGEQGLYFTDDFLEVSFGLLNVTPKRLRGAIRVFYGFGPSGLEGKTAELITFDLNPSGQKGDSDVKQGLRRLVGVQGNGVIALALPPPGRESEAKESENDAEIVLRAATSTAHFHTLYSFTTMEREFYKRFYVRPERIMDQTRKLTVALTVLTLVLTLFSVAAFILSVVALGKT